MGVKKTWKNLLFLLFLVCFCSGLLFAAALNASPVVAYTTNMSADVVIGQQNFTSVASNQGITRAANTISGPVSSFIYNGKLIVSDRGNHRVLIYNQLPTTNNTSADVVVGQPSFSTGTANNGGRNANTLNFPSHAIVVQGKLVVADLNNHRVLIYNQIPTSNNTSADVVIGQTNFTSGSANQGGSVAANTLSGPNGVAYYNGKLFISDRSNHRVLIYNQIPTSNNASADVVIGQTNFTSGSANQGGSVAANTLSNPTALSIVDNALYISESGNHRVLIYNQIPTSNNASADVVIGQTNFTSGSANQGGSPTAQTLSSPIGVSSDGQRLFISDDGNHRVLIYNQIPTTNNPAADIAIGQPNMVSNSENQGGSPNANTLRFPINQTHSGDKLIVPDFTNSRILIFTNITKNVGLSLDNNPTSIAGNMLGMTGTASTESPYIVSSVLFSVNGGGWSGAIPQDGNFDSAVEQYLIQFDPSSNQPKDSNGNLIDGYTIQVKMINSNGDSTDQLFYFSPFILNSPEDKAFVDNEYPTFEFAVNKQTQQMADNLSKYQVWVNRTLDGNTPNWQVLIDNIPINFNAAKNNVENLQRENWTDPNLTDGVYETNAFYATYSDSSSRISVYSKSTALAGASQWKVVAIDNLGHTQETGARTLFTSTNTFPFAVLNITGVGNPNLNSFTQSTAPKSLVTTTATPTFFGIAPISSTVTLTLIDVSCAGSSENANCTSTYTTIANADSRFGISLPKGAIRAQRKYVVSLSAKHDETYTVLPTFLFYYGQKVSSSIGPTTIPTQNAQLLSVLPTLLTFIINQANALIAQ